MNVSADRESEVYVHCCGGRHSEVLRPHPQISFPSQIRKGIAQGWCCQEEAGCSCGYGDRGCGDRSPGSRGQQGREEACRLGWSRPAGGQKEAFKTPAPPAGEQCCVKSSSVVSLPTQWQFLELLVPLEPQQILLSEVTTKES